MESVGLSAKANLKHMKLKQPVGPRLGSPCPASRTGFDEPTFGFDRILPRYDPLETLPANAISDLEALPSARGHG